jgi:hypothetical protein
MLLALVAPASGAHAQDLEPRAYANTPVGMSFLLVGYRYTHGNVSVMTSGGPMAINFRWAIPLAPFERTSSSTFVTSSRTVGP